MCASARRYVPSDTRTGLGFGARSLTKPCLSRYEQSSCFTVLQIGGLRGAKHAVGVDGQCCFNSSKVYRHRLSFGLSSRKSVSSPVVIRAWSSLGFVGPPSFLLQTSQLPDFYPPTLLELKQLRSWGDRSCLS